MLVDIVGNYHYLSCISIISSKDKTIHLFYKIRQKGEKQRCSFNMSIKTSHYMHIGNHYRTLSTSGHGLSYIIQIGYESCLPDFERCIANVDKISRRRNLHCDFGRA